VCAPSLKLGYAVCVRRACMFIYMAVSQEAASWCCRVVKEKKTCEPSPRAIHRARSEYMFCDASTFFLGCSKRCQEENNSFSTSIVSATILSFLSAPRTRIAASRRSPVVSISFYLEHRTHEDNAISVSATPTSTRKWVGVCVVLLFRLDFSLSYTGF
jgi:hypothetical protein